jgi:hypothetical protein
MPIKPPITEAQMQSAATKVSIHLEGITTTDTAIDIG